MTMFASPDQIFRSTATNSTCRVATTLLWITDGKSTLARQSEPAPSRAPPRACEGWGGGCPFSGRAAVQQRPAAHAHPGMPHAGGGRPVLGAEAGLLDRFPRRVRRPAPAGFGTAGPRCVRFHVVPQGGARGSGGSLTWSADARPASRDPSGDPPTGVTPASPGRANGRAPSGTRPSQGSLQGPAPRAAWRGEEGVLYPFLSFSAFFSRSSRPPCMKK